MFNRFFIEKEVVADIESAEPIAGMAEEIVSPAGGFFRTISRWCILVLAFLLPIWFLPVTIAPVFANKAFMVFSLVLLSLVSFAIYAILRGRIEIPWHWLFMICTTLLGAWIVSALMSAQTLSGLLGATGFESHSVIALAIFLILVFLIAVLFADYADQIKLLIVLGLGSVALMIFMVFFALGWGKIFGPGFENVSFNAVGSWRSLAFVLGFFTMLVYPFLLTAAGKFKWILTVLFVASILALVVVNFPLVWGILGFFAIIFLSYSIWQRNVSAAVLGASMVLLLASLFGYFSQDAINSILKMPAPVEVNVSYRATLDITKKILSDHLVFGSGPETFMHSWDNLRPADVNQTVFWNTRFNSGASFLLTLASEVGLVGFVLFVLLLLSWWYLLLRNLMRAPVGDHIFALSAFLLASYTILMWSLYPTNYTLVALGFIAMGFGFAVLRGSGYFRSFDIVLFREGPSGFIFSLLLVFVLLVGVAGMYLIGARYVGQVVYARGVFAFNSEGNVDAAESNIARAYGFDRWNSAYPLSLGQIALVRAKTLLQTNANTRDLLGSQFKTMLDNSVRLHKEAIDLAPQDFGNYESLGKVYEFLVSAGVDGASDVATAQYDKAIELAPQNPVLYSDKAAVYIAEALRTKDMNMLKKAEESLVRATELKPDYTEAHFLLAQVFDAEGNLPEATKRAEAAALLAPNDIGSLFQLGLLYYKADRFPEAEQVLLAALRINANYSNARYFLGLIYDKTNHRDAALDQFVQIQNLNPGNKEIETIIVNLRAGRGALSSISTQPDKRSKPPIND